VNLDAEKLSKRIAALVAGQFRTYHYVRVCDNPAADPERIRIQYEDWLAAEVRRLIGEELAGL